MHFKVYFDIHNFPHLEEFSVNITWTLYFFILELENGRFSIFKIKKFRSH